MVLPGDVPPKPRKKAKAKPSAAAGDASGPPAETETPPPPEPAFEDRFDRPWTTRTATSYTSPKAKHAKETGLSTAITDDLAAIRIGVVRAALAKRFGVAFDHAAYLLIMDAAGRARSERPADIRLGRTSLRRHGRQNDGDFADANSGEKLHAPPPGKWMKIGDELKRFDAFRALPADGKRGLFARAVATALHHEAANQHQVIRATERIVELLDIDFAAAVRPTEEYFWKCLTRARLLETAEAVVGEDWGAARLNHKKGELAAAIATVFGPDPAGRLALDADARERIERWTMPGFRPWDAGLDKAGAEAAAGARTTDS